MREAIPTFADRLFEMVNTINEGSGVSYTITVKLPPGGSKDETEAIKDILCVTGAAACETIRDLLQRPDAVITTRLAELETP